MQGDQAKEKTYYFKQNIGVINDIEAYVSAKFRRLLGKQRVGRCKAVYFGGMRRGVVSREIPAFITLRQILDADEYDPRITTAALIKAGYGRIETANYVLANPDAHWNNVGYTENNILAVIDFDWVMPDVILKHKGFKPESVLRKNFPPVKDMYVVTTRDLINLPLLTDARPFNGLCHEYLTDEMEEELEEFKDDPDFIFDKWYTCFLYLLTEGLHESLAEQYLSSENIRREIFQFELKRKKQLQNALLQIPQFVSFIVDNDLLNRIKSELQEHAKSLLWASHN